jgi:uncharacterized protein
MPFRPLSPRDVSWRPASGEGLEETRVEPAREGGFVMRGVLIARRDRARYGVAYTIRCDETWAVRKLRVQTTAGQSVALDGDGQGNWTGTDGRERPELSGCVDVDLAGTPLTNTLPIRRLGLRPGAGTAEISVAYLPFDTFAPRAERQRYTCLKEGQLYRFQSGDRLFTADLPVDEDGLVLDYPILFKRI